MTTTPIFRGVATAIITPTNEHGVDYESFGRIIDWQIAEGINAIVVCGTTGENPTLSDDEHKQCIRFCVERVNHRVPVIAGTGSNDTAHAIMMTQFACAIGADAVLCVTPYYNRPTQSGLIASFTAIADAATAPVILYNIPSRTGTSIEPETFEVLGDHPNIVGIKEASGRLPKIMETFRRVHGKLDVYSGNDDQTLPLLAMGGKGLISVAANVVPAQTVALCEKFFAGDVAGAADVQLELLPLMQALFYQTNPIPVKAALARMGRIEDRLRLPLTPMEEPHRGKLFRIMEEMGLI